MEPETARMAALILAAGAATRMGTLKQMLPLGGGTMLSHAIEQALAAGFARVIVVLGAHADAVRASIANLPVEVAVNEEWEAGMGTSIAAGLQQLETEGPRVEALAILLADQPHVQASHLIAMKAAFAASAAPVIAADYGGALGAPAMFRASAFAALAALHPSTGARQLLRGGGFAVTPYALPEALTDIDTPADFAALESVRG